MTTKSPSHFRQHIEDHFDEHDLDVLVRKRRQSYNVHWECDDEPLARLRPTGKGDEVELFWWDDDRWQAVGEFGLALPLDEALQLVTDDPDGLFFDEYADEDDDETEAWESHLPREVRERLETGARFVRAHMAVCSMFGAAAGGMFGHLPRALLAGTAAAFLSCLILVLWASRGRGILPIAYMAFLTALSACVGIITGSAVHGGLAGVFWPLLCGTLVGGLCNWLLWKGGFGSWWAGFLAGLNLAVALVGWWDLGGQFWGYVIVALFATAAGTTCREVVRFVLRPDLIPAPTVVVNVTHSEPKEGRD